MWFVRIPAGDVPQTWSATVPLKVDPKAAEQMAPFQPSPGYSPVIARQSAAPTGNGYLVRQLRGLMRRNFAGCSYARIRGSLAAYLEV